MPRADRGRRPRLRRRQAAARPLRGPRGARVGGARGRRRGGPRRGPARHRRRQARRRAGQRRGLRRRAVRRDRDALGDLRGARRRRRDPQPADGRATRSSRSSPPRPTAGAGIFVLVRTSNPGAADLLDARCRRGPSARADRPHASTGLADRLAGSGGFSGAGAVVGATEPRFLARLRELMPRAIFLLPGVGAQGGSAERARGRVRRARLGTRHRVAKRRLGGRSGRRGRGAAGAGLVDRRRLSRARPRVPRMERGPERRAPARPPTLARARSPPRPPSSIPASRPPALERPPRPEFGDYSTNAAMLAAPLIGEPPRDVAAAADRAVSGSGSASASSGSRSPARASSTCTCRRAGCATRRR